MPDSTAAYLLYGLPVKDGAPDFSRPPWGWPPEKPLPATLRECGGNPVPCPWCRRMRLRDGAPATIVMSQLVGRRYCRACGRSWPEPEDPKQLYPGPKHARP